MARTTFISKCKRISHADPIIHNMLVSEGFELILENNENVCKRGNGAWISIKYVKIEYADDTTVHITGYVKSTVGPEQNLDGIIGGLPKKLLLNVIHRMQAAIL